MGIAIAITAISIASAAAAAETAPQTQPALDEQLVSLLHQYFTTDQSRDRARVAGQIATLDNVNIDAVTAALASLDIWEPIAPGTNTISVDVPPAPGKEIHIIELSVRIPEGYDAKQPTPLLLALHDTEQTAADYLADAEKLLGDRIDEFIIATPADYRGVWLSSSRNSAGDWPRIVDELKRKYRIDSNRIFLLGTGYGGHAALSAAILYPDLFAGVIAIDGAIVTDAGWDAVNLLLPSLGDVPVLAICHCPEAEKKQGDANRRGGASICTNGVCPADQYIAALAKEAKVRFDVLQIPQSEEAATTIPPERLTTILDHQRPTGNMHIEHWFRYPEQGRLAWLRQTEFDGQPWRAEQLIVSPAPTETHSQAVTALLRDRLARVAGTIEGQTIRIQTNNTDEIQLLLNTKLIDATKRITIFVDGTKRYEGQPNPTIQTLLDQAYLDWDFDRPWPIRFAISKKGLARRE